MLCWDHTIWLIGIWLTSVSSSLSHGVITYVLWGYGHNHPRKNCSPEELWCPQAQYLCSAPILTWKQGKQCLSRRAHVCILTYLSGGTAHNHLLISCGARRSVVCCKLNFFSFFTFFFIYNYFSPRMVKACSHPGCNNIQYVRIP